MLLCPCGELFRVWVGGEVAGDMDCQDISEFRSIVHCNNLPVVVGYYLILIFSVIGFVKWFSVFVR